MELAITYFLWGTMSSFEIDSVKDAGLLLELDKFAKLYGCEGVSAKYDEMLVSLTDKVVEEFEDIWHKEGEME